MVHLTDLSLEIAEMEKIVAAITKYHEENVIEMNVSLDTAKKDLNTLFVQVKELSKQLKAREHENVRLNHTLEKELEKSHMLVCSLQTHDSDTLKKCENNESLRKEISYLLMDIKKHRSQYKTVHEQLENKVLEYEETHQKYTETIQDNESLKKENNNLLTEIKKHQSKNKMIQEEFKNKVREYEETLQKYTETVQKNDELEKTNKQLSMDIEKIKKSTNKEIDKNEEIDTNYKNTEAECLRCIATTERLQNKLLEQQNYVNDNESLKKENNNLLMELKKHHSQYKTIQEELQNKVLEYDGTLHKYTETIQVNKKLEEEIKIMRLENKKLIEEKNNMILENEKFKAECIQLEAKLIEKDFLVHNTVAKIKDVENHTDNKKTELMNEKQLLSERLEKVIIEKQVLSEKIAKAHYELDLLRQNLKSSKEKTKKVCVQLEESNQHHQEELDSLTAQHDQLLHRNIRYEIDVAYYKSVISNNEDEILKLQTQIEENRTENADKSTITDSLQNELSVDVGIVTDVVVSPRNTSGKVAKAEKGDKSTIAESCSMKKYLSVDVGVSTDVVQSQRNASGKVDTAEVGIVTDAFEYSLFLKNAGEKEINKIVGQFENKRERAKGVSDKTCFKVKSIDDIKKLGKNPMLSEQNICDLLREVKRFYEATIGELHRKYKEESERQRTFYEASLSKLNYYNKEKLRYMKKEHDDKVKRLLDVHEEEIKKMSLHQQWMHSISEKMNKPTKAKKQKQ